jgi:hypothetical protein
MGRQAGPLLLLASCAAWLLVCGNSASAAAITHGDFMLFSDYKTMFVQVPASQHTGFSAACTSTGSAVCPHDPRPTIAGQHHPTLAEVLLAELLLQAGLIMRNVMQPRVQLAATKRRGRCCRSFDVER